MGQTYYWYASRAGDFDGDGRLDALFSLSSASAFGRSSCGKAFVLLDCNSALGHGEADVTSVLAQAWYVCEPLFTVEPGSFIPPPKVRSAVIRMRRNEEVRLACDERLFHQVVKTAFNQRRKTLSNALKSFDPLKGGVPEAFAKKRAEQLSVPDFVALTQACSV